LYLSFVFFQKTLNPDGYLKINIPNKTLYQRHHNFCYFIRPFVGSAVRIIAEERFSCTLIKNFSFPPSLCAGESAAVDVKEKYHIFFSIRLHFEKRGGEPTLNCVSRESCSLLGNGRNASRAQPTPAAADVMQTAEQCTATGCISAAPQGQSTRSLAGNRRLAGWLADDTRLLHVCRSVAWHKRHSARLGR
jgi:hypothetical protein